VRIGPRGLRGDLQQPGSARALVLFAHGSGSSRLSRRNRWVAAVLQRHRLSTLLFDLLDADEAADRRKVFDVGLLAERVGQALDWAAGETALGGLSVGLFGASTGAAAALCAAAARPGRVAAVVSRGGRPDLAGPCLAQVQAPTLLIVGAADAEVLALNRQALRELRCQKRLEVVPGATHLFEEPGALGSVAELAAAWFETHLDRRGVPQ
jgi:pimeloyl-ACP methyl ester carboxylesterase